MQIGRRLFWLNAIACCLHGFNTIGILITGFLVDPDIYLRPIFQVDLRFDNSTRSLIPSFPTKPQYHFNLPVLSAVTTLLACVFHGIYASGCRDDNGPYLRMLRTLRGNPLRWIEYSFSAGIMIVLIAHAFGVVTLELLLSQTVLIFATMMFGLVTEENAARGVSSRAGQDWKTGSHWVSLWCPTWRQQFNTSRSCRKRWYRLRYHWCGWLTMGMAWYPPIRRFSDAYTLSQGKTPDFVAAILASELTLFGLFGLLGLYQFWTVDKHGAPSIQRVMRVEVLMMIASLSSKTILAWLLVAIIWS